MSSWVESRLQINNRKALRKTRREGRKQGNSGSGVKSWALLFIPQNYVVHLGRVLSILWKIVHVKVSIGVAKFILQLRLFRYWEAARVCLYQSRVDKKRIKSG